MKNNILKKILLTGALAFAPVIVNAESANISIVGNNEAYLNDTVTLNVRVDHIEDVEEGIVAIGGDIVYDNEYLELVSATPAQNPYRFDGNSISANTYRIAGVDFTMNNGIKSDTIVYSLVFKTNKLGQTKVSFNNADIVNVNAKNIEGSTISKFVNILAKEEIKQEIVETMKEVNNIVVLPTIKESVNNKKTIDNIQEVVVNNNMIVNNEKTINNKIAIIDRLKPFTFNMEVKGLNIMDVQTYSIFNFKREK